MGYKRYQLILPSDYGEEDLKKRLQRESGLSDFRWVIEKKSLDARKRSRISWLLTVAVISEELKGDAWEPPETLSVPKKKREQRVLVAGTGPAGIFAALLLCEAGFPVSILERGGPIEERRAAIEAFESGGDFSGQNNYAFGEGGAGAFSDGKLTSRSKRIRAERVYIHNAFIEAGAPEEIAWLAHPHIGSDNLYRVTAALRRKIESLGGVFHFHSRMTGFSALPGGGYRVLVDGAGDMETDVLIIATGHSSDDTSAALMGLGVPFRTKNFAMGCRVEHPQELINRAQWGVPRLPGVKAAEYRLTAPGNVFTFCMCPGGRVIPAAPFAERNLVNGMSLYLRNGRFANSALVAALHPDELAGKEVSPREALALVAALEERFFEAAQGYGAPASSIAAFLEEKAPGSALPESSYPFPLVPADPAGLYPHFLLERIGEGMRDFGRRIRGFESGIMLGLESRTSSSVQVLREADGSIPGFPDLYIAGEASGRAGGIISSAADGIGAALSLIRGR